MGSRGSQRKPLRQWLHPQSFWLFSHACQPPCRCTEDWKVPDCSGWMPKSFGPRRHDHWSGRLGDVPQGGPSPTAHHGAAPPAPLSCSTRSCPWSTDCIMLLGAHPWWAASSPSCPCCVQWSGQVEWHHGPVSKSPGSACAYIHRWSLLFPCWWFPKVWRSSRPVHTLSWPKRCASLCPPPSSWSPCPSQSSHFPRWWGGVVDQDIPSAKESSSRSQRRRQLHPTQEPQLAGLDPNQMPEWPHQSSSTCDREVQHGQGQPLPTTTVPCCIAMPPSLPHRSWTAHRAPAWHRPPQRDEAPQRGRRSSHRTWLGTGAAPWNPPHLPQASPSQEPECG